MYHLIRFIKYLFTFAPCVIYFNITKCSVANSFRNPLQKTHIEPCDPKTRPIWIIGSFCKSHTGMLITNAYC